MRQYLEALANISSWMRNDPRIAVIEQALREGVTEGKLELPQPPDRFEWWSDQLVAELPPLGELEPLDRFVLGVVAAISERPRLDDYLAESLRCEEPGSHLFDRFVEAATTVGAPVDAVLSRAAVAPKRYQDGTLNSVSHWLLQRQDIADWYPGQAHRFKDLEAFVAYLAASDPARLERLAETFAHDRHTCEWSPAARPSGCLVREGGTNLRPALERLFTNLEPWSQLHLGLALAQDRPDEWFPLVLSSAKVVGHELREDRPDASRSLLVELANVFGSQSAPLLAELFQVEPRESRLENPHKESLCLGKCISAVGEPAALGLARQLAQRPGRWPSLVGIWGLSRLESPEAAHEARTLVVEALSRHADNDPAAGGVDHGESAIAIAVDLGGSEVVSVLSRLMEHVSEALRTAAARGVAKLAGDDAIGRALELLGMRAAARRQAGVRALVALGSDAALEVLDHHIGRESDPKIRTEAFSALVPWWQRIGRTVTRDELEVWIELANRSLSKPPSKWWKFVQLPQLTWTDGSAVDPLAVRWLCFRQSQSKDATLDPEASMLTAMLDPEVAADWAFELLSRWRGTAMTEAADKWVLGLAGALGDNRVSQPLADQAVRWTEKKRGKMAEYAAQALAAVGTDEALMLVDDLAARYASKNRNVGAAAAAAFASAAHLRGISVDELGDGVVPWLGFVPGARRLVDSGSRQIEIKVGLDGKVRFLDRTNAKRLKGLPSGVDPEVKSEIKALAASLRTAMKAQRHRHERMLVTQRRWPCARWLELYPDHPVLAAFAVTLVWGGYGTDGALRCTFRMLEDRSFTDADDEEVNLGSIQAVGLVHPLELDEPQIAAWNAHLSDHEVDPPFPQLDRPVHPLTDADRDLRQLDIVDGTEISAGTFRGRAERRGWHRGSVVDAGGVTSYRRTFPAAGIDVFLMLDDLFIGIEPTDAIHLRQAYFVSGGSVQTGSYVYDEPENANDDRVLAFSDVPAIVYSETVADLKLIAGADATEDDD